MTDKKLHIILGGCKKQDKRCQKELFMHMRNYGLTITNRYASSIEEAEEILHDGFLKVFANIREYNDSNHFKNWFRKIMINVSIDYFRKYKLKSKRENLIPLLLKMDESVSNVGLDNLQYEDLMSLVRSLSPAYRIVFLLFAVEGFKHIEISKKLNISTGTSKSNLSKARSILQNKISENMKMRQYG